MKNLHLILGIALVSFTNVCNAANTVGRPGSSSNEDFSTGNKNEILSTEKVKVTKPSLGRDTEVFNPETVIAYNRKTTKEIMEEDDKIIENTVSDDFEFMAFEESMKEIIAQSDLIIENTVSNETYPLFYERTLEDEICELEMIIESKETNEIQPLDFKKINSNSLPVNTFVSKKIIGMN